MNIDQVKALCQHLNSKANLSKKNERVRAKALARANQDDLIESAFLPKIIAKAFEEKVIIRRFSGDEKSARFNRLTSHWKFAQKLIADLQIDPKDYSEESLRIYRYLEAEKISPAYTLKILRILNAWGQFYTKQTGGTGIEEVRMPRGKARQDIARSYHNKDDYRGPADPISPEELESKRQDLLDYNYNWLYLSIWLGLRPEEVDHLKNRDHYRFGTAEDGETAILWVFQTKLTSVTEEKAWKPIPLFHPRQKTCLEIIAVGNFKRPLNKTLRKVFHEKRVTAYSGRKSFTDLMQTHGQQLEEISIWLGHTSIETTWKHYKQKQIVRFKKVS